MALAKSHGISVPRFCQNALRDGREYHIIRDHFLNAISQEMGRARAFASFLQPVANATVPDGAPESTLTIHEVTDFPSLVRFAQMKQQPGLPDNLRRVIRYLHGGVAITKRKLTTWAKELGVTLHTKSHVYRSHTADISNRVRLEAVRYELQLHCFQLATSHTAAADGKAATGPEDSRTPRSLKELLVTLRDPSGCAICPFGVDFMHVGNELAPRGLANLKPQLVHVLALMELHQYGYRYAAGLNQNPLPLSYTALAKKVHQQRSATAAGHDLTTVDALADAINRNPVWQSPLFSWMLSLFTATHLTGLSEGAQSSAFEGAQSTSGAKQIATAFLEYVGKHDMHEAVLSMTPTQVQVVAMFHAQLQARPRKRVQLTERWEFLQQKPAYVPASEVYSPATPHFALVADAADESHGQAVLQAPVVCQLCGAGCLSRQALWRHCELRHHSWCEYRKRLIFEVQQRNAVPLRPVEKRRLAGNYMQDLLHSYPGRGTVKPGECTMRQVVACAVCAVKDWIDDYYPCYLWQEAPSLHQSTQMPENEENSEVEDGEQQQQQQQQQGYSFPPAFGCGEIRSRCASRSCGGIACFVGATPELPGDALAIAHQTCAGAAGRCVWRKWRSGCCRARADRRYRSRTERRFPTSVCWRGRP